MLNNLFERLRGFVLALPMARTANTKKVHVYVVVSSHFPVSAEGSGRMEAVWSTEPQLPGCGADDTGQGNL
jgi:hypothetical protein